MTSSPGCFCRCWSAGARSCRCRDPGCIESAIRDARQRGLQPLQLSFLPFQDVYLTPSAPNVVFPFWEFPDVPAEAFDGNPRNNWVATANRCDLVLVGGQFTVEAFERAGIRTAIRVVPVPTPNAYFHLPRWSGESVTRIACPAYVFPHPQVPTHELWDAPDAEQHDENRPARPSLKARVARPTARDLSPSYETTDSAHPPRSDAPLRGPSDTIRGGPTCGTAAARNCNCPASSTPASSARTTAARTGRICCPASCWRCAIDRMRL